MHLIKFGLVQKNVGHIGDNFAFGIYHPKDKATSGKTPDAGREQWSLFLVMILEVLALVRLEWIARVV